MKEELKIAAVFIGTIVGAGLASGQEILQFFSYNGFSSFYGIILCTCLYIVFTKIILSLCFKFRFKSYIEIINYVFSNKFGKAFHYLTTFFIFSGNIIMISGGGAMLHEYLGIDKFWGALIMALFSFMITIYSTKGIIVANSIIVPFSAGTIMLLGLLVFLTFKNNFPNSLTTLAIPTCFNVKGIFSSIIYASFNLLGVTGVLCPMICEANNKKVFNRGCNLGILILTILALAINFSILCYAPKSFAYEIPNLYISKHYGTLLPLILSMVIWLEMLSTEIGDLYSLSKAVQHSTHLPYINSLVIILLASIPFTFVGFSNLIKLLYPAFGILSFLFIIGCLHKYVILKKEL